MNTKAGKLRGKLGSFAKEREEFELKKKELEEEMNREKQNMGKIRKGLRGNDLNFDTHQNMNEEEDENYSKRGLKNNRNMKNSQSESTDQLLKAPPIPSGPKISDWCYVGPIDSSPPIIKSQELYEDVRFLGRGAYGTVDLVKNREDNKLYASKTLLLQHKSDEKGFFHEVKFLRQHRHPFIIHLHDVFMSTHPRKVFLIMHYCEGGDLGKIISVAAKNNQPLNETQILKWISQVALALSYLHGCNIAHRDIKPVNILLSDNGEVAQLADFGLATELNNSSQKESSNTAEVGTPYYTSPEMINNEPCTLATDCWSLGVCFFEMLALRLPFDGDTTVALVKSILQDQPDLSLIPSNYYSTEISVPLEGLLIKDPNARITINQFLSTPPISGRAASLPSQYRPKYLEERLRRYHAKQMTNQLDKLGISTTTPQQLQNKSLNTPSDRGGGGGVKLNPLGEDDDDKGMISSGCASRSTTRDRNIVSRLYDNEQHEIQLSVDVEENHEEITSLPTTSYASTPLLNDLKEDSHAPPPLHLHLYDPKDGIKSPMLPSLHSKEKENSLSNKSGATISLSSSEVNTPISINMKSIKMISSTERSDALHSTHDEMNNKYSNIGSIELASNYLKKHLQNQQFNDLHVDLDNLATSSPNGISIDKELARPSSSSSSSSSLKISPRPLFSTLTSSSNTTPLTTSLNSVNTHPPTHHKARPHSIPLEPVPITSIKSSDSLNSLPEKTFTTITSLPPLIKLDSSGSSCGNGNGNGNGSLDYRPSSTDSALKSGRKEKKIKHDRGSLNENCVVNINSSPTLLLTPLESSTEVLFNGEEGRSSPRLGSGSGAQLQPQPRPRSVSGTGLREGSRTVTQGEAEKGSIMRAEELTQDVDEEFKDERRRSELINDEIKKPILMEVKTLIEEMP